MVKKLCTLIGIIVLVAVLVVGGYFVYTKVIAKNVGEFQIQYSHEKYMEGYEVYYNFVKGYTGKSVEDIVIAETFEQDGTSYTTNAIRANAFKNNKVVKTIDIPKNIYVFESNILSGCNNLTTITIRLQEETYITNTMFSMVFNGVDLTNVTFNVAKQSVKDAILNSYSTANVVVDSSLLVA